MISAQDTLPEIYLKHLVNDLLQPLRRIECLQLICGNHLLQFGCDIPLIILIWACRGLLRGCPMKATQLAVGGKSLLTRVATLLTMVATLLPKVTTLLTALLPRVTALLTGICLLLRGVAT